MRYDAPPCRYCKEEIVKIENNTFFMSAFGILSRTPVRFIVNLTFFQPVSIVDSTWSYENIGAYYFNFAKMDDTLLWSNLESN